MRRPAPLRPELVSVCRYLAGSRPGRSVRPAQCRPGVGGILGALADGMGRQ